MLNATLQKHLQQFSTPVAQDMKESMYVDNILSGSDTELKSSSDTEFKYRIKNLTKQDRL